MSPLDHEGMPFAKAIIAILVQKLCRERGTEDVLLTQEDLDQITSKVLCEGVSGPGTYVLKVIEREDKVQ